MKLFTVIAVVSARPQNSAADHLGLAWKLSVIIGACVSVSQQLGGAPQCPGYHQPEVTCLGTSPQCPGYHQPEVTCVSQQLVTAPQCPGYHQPEVTCVSQQLSTSPQCPGYHQPEVTCVSQQLGTAPQCPGYHQHHNVKGIIKPRLLV
ncbi:hypothetical protein PoB_007456200 [Plakobranchus ocellatus]|uniref:Uncharacterized protein n=1 Tax=Plakobranchus ocellatus TaxID=259542 RepID=A0AAV4DUR0_9GAST|nr:hypothetical protein PoB_007456200 [Plakobranchus ocellatus]